MFGFLFIVSFKMLFRDPEWTRKIPVGGLMIFAPTFALTILLSVEMPTLLIPVVVAGGILPMLAGWGYVFHMFVDALNGVECPMLPEWKSWQSYILGGFWLLLIVLGYILVAAILMTLLITLFGITASSGEGGQMGGVLFLMMVASVLLYACFPIAFARFAATDRILMAFHPGLFWMDVKRLIRGIYIQACVAFYVLSLMVNLVLGAFPYIGLVLVSIALFLLMLIFALVFGKLIGVREQTLFPPQES
jgi:hypothetical protein